ncbi:MAG: hypothetical protein A7316_03045 [Candidatus Altiarchaeales archaeon WOR_SM1_86-2]|nr:MAG: hypothetical protein A7316_03045 [Candidatus Altiarchaeales archaeon WOR_SM1_86-2]
MENETKKRVALIVILLAIGAILGGVGNIFGGGEVHPEITKKVITVEMTEYRDKVVMTMYEDGGIIDTSTRIKEEGEGCGVYAKEADNLLETAGKDSGVKGLIEGKDYKAIGFKPVLEPDMPEGVSDSRVFFVVLILEVEGSYYEVLIEKYSETVKSIDKGLESYDEEVILKPEDDMEDCDPDKEFEKMANSLLEIAMNDSRVRELIEGKEYQVISVSHLMLMGERKLPKPLEEKPQNITTTLMLEVEGRCYNIVMDMGPEGEMVRAVERGCNK